MTNTLLSLVLIMVSFNIFNLTFKISNFNEALYKMPKAVFENSIQYVTNDFIIQSLTFDKHLLESNIENYFKNNVNKYSGSYKIDYFYFNSQDKLICKGTKCDGVKITLESELMPLINYKRSISYYIKENKQ